MPTYTYRCRECSDEFEVRRPMSESSAPTACPGGHEDTVKLLATVAMVGREAAPAGGGCCGGACGCGAR